MRSYDKVSWHDKACTDIMAYIHFTHEKGLCTSFCSQV